MRQWSFGLLVACLALSGCRHGDLAAMTRPFHQAAARHHARQADACSIRGDDAGAAMAYETALNHDPHNAAMHANAAATYARRGQLDFAVGHYQAAVRADPNSIEYALALAQTLVRHAAASVDRRERLEAGARAYRHALWLDPARLDASVGLASCYRSLGRSNEAIQTLREAATLDPSSVRVRMELASIHEELGDDDAALTEYAQALRLDPDNVAIHNACGSLNLALSRKSKDRRPLARERAVAHFRKSLDISPDQPSIHALLTQLESPFADAARAD